MAAIVSPKPGVLHKLAQEKIQRERKAQQAIEAGHRPPPELEEEPEVQEELHEPDDEDDDDDLDEDAEGDGEAEAEAVGDEKK